MPAKVKETSPLAIHRTIERSIFRQTFFGAKPTLPIDRLGRHVASELIVSPLAGIGIPIELGLKLQDLADRSVVDQFTSLIPDRQACRLNTDLHHFSGRLPRIDDIDRLLDGLGHRLFAIDMLAGV